MKVLLVDDNKAARNLLRRSLLDTGIADLEVHEAANGSDALALLHETEPDLILSDWMMPETTGVQLVRELRARHCDVQFGFVTNGAPSTAMCEKGYAAGAQFFVDRSLSAQRLLGVLNDLLP